MNNSNDKVLDLYISSMPDGDITSELIPIEREREVRSVRSESVRREKYFVWKLLEYAIEHSFGMRISDVELTKSKSGKWISPHFEFSISHSGDALAVAVSTHPVGVDIERIIEPKAQKFASRILTSAEYEHYTTLSDDARRIYLTERWTCKESIFKKLSKDAFVPSSYEPQESECLTDRIEINGKTYIYSLSSDIIEEANSIIKPKL